MSTAITEVQTADAEFDKVAAGIAALKEQIDAELKRIKALKDRVAELRGCQTLTPTSGSATIAERIADLERIPVDESFEEFWQQANDAKAAGLARLRELHTAAVTHEAEQARIQVEREELAKLRAEAEKRDAEDRARLAEEERKAKAQRLAEAARQAAELKAQREKQEAEAKKLADERAEFERQQAEVRRAKEEADRVERERARIASLKKPTDDELIRVLAEYYSAPERKVVEWILAIDFSKRETA